MITKVFILRFANGETGMLNELDNHSYACPICGTPWERFPPYYPNDGQLGSLKKVSGAMVGEVCPGCNVEFGVEEGCGSAAPIGFMKQQWTRLRTGWLDRVGWSPEALRQLHDNLGITEEQARREAEEVRKQ